jgi:hypothetical protein
MSRTTRLARNPLTSTTSIRSTARNTCATSASKASEEELREASTAYANHALALTLLGTYLVDFCDKDVRRRIEIPKLMVDELKAGVHARHVMAAYARMFEGKPELGILRALAYFDRPA